MKLQDILVPVSLALLVMVGYNYFFSKRSESTGPVADRQFVAPTSMQVAEPLDVAIDFYDTEKPLKKSIETLIMPYGTLQFSNYGGVIDFIGFKRMLAGKPSLLEILTPQQNLESGAFLVALDGIGKTPLYYELVNKKEQDGATVLTYKGTSKAATITKEFTVHNDTYVIDLALTIEPRESVRPRIFFPAPKLALDDEDYTKTVVTSGGYLKKSNLKDLLQVGVELPTVFGLEDTYFANVLFKDPQQFAQRAYFKLEDGVSQAVLQSQAIAETTTWHTSFYVGPKELKELTKVDPRLEGLLSYGWFAPISKLLLRLLNWLYGFLGNYGLAIIVLTIIVRLLLVPFTWGQEKQRRKQMDISKKLKYIEERYKDNPEELARAKMEFMRKHGLPGLSGFLGMFLQIPVFIGLQRVLSNAIELYKAPFLWIPDLSAPDPWYILPLIFAGAFILTMSQQGDAKQQLTNMIVAVVIAAVMSSFSAGLALYIAVSTLLGFGQAYLQRVLA